MKSPGVLLAAVLIHFAVALAIIPPSLAESNPEKAKDIRRLLKVSGIQEQLGYMKANVLDSYAQALSFSYPDAPKEFWQGMNDVIDEKDMAHLVDRVVLVYDKHMDHEVVKKLIAMFETPFWEEWRAKMPTISREAGMVGNQWARELADSKVLEKRIDALVKKFELDKGPGQKKP